MTREEAIELLCAYGVPQDEKRFQVALDMAIEALSKPKVAYACDSRRCGADCCGCGRTTDIKHAKNFTKICDSYLEKLHTEPSDLISRADAIDAVRSAIRKEWLLREAIVTDIEELPSAEPSVEIKECKPLCTEQKIAVEEFLNAPRITEECAIELLQMTGWLQEHDKEIGRPSGEWVCKDGVYGAVYCSNCDYELRCNNTNFCPNCGARMKGGAE